MIQPVATAAPYMVGIGNHEFVFSKPMLDDWAYWDANRYDYMYQKWAPKWGPYGNDSGGECGIPYSSRFHMPNSPPANQVLNNREYRGLQTNSAI